jgi:hypothetical protein
VRRSGKSKTCVWRWQERFMAAGVDEFFVGKIGQGILASA